MNSYAQRDSRMGTGERRLVVLQWASIAVCISAAIQLDRASADTINSALIEAYRSNPQLNAQRSAARAVDENVAIAVAGYRPRVTGTSSITEIYLDTLTKVPGTGRYTRFTGENA